MVPPAVRPNYQVVDLTIDDEYEAFSEDVASQDEQYREPTNEEEDYNLDDLPAYDYTNIDNQGVIDLTAIPDIDVPPSEHYSLGEDADSPGEMVDAELITEAVCLQLVLDVLPDVSVDHVLTIIQEKTTDLTRTKEHSEWVVNELLESTYPKEADVASKKRKREDSEGPSDYKGEEFEAGAPSYKKDALNLLKDEFLNVPARHIENTFKQKKTLFKSYIVLEDQVRKYQQTTRTFIKSPRPRNKRGIELLLIESGSRLPKELRAAKEKTEHEAVKRRKLEDAKQVEEDNLQQAMTEKLMRECQCCFTEYPLNRMVSCSGRKTHLFCMDCPRQYIETEMGQSKCRPVCFASTECNGTFSRAQLQQILDRKSFERLEHMQQQQDIAAAGLDFLSECPFCDYKAECLPVEQDKEFRCQNTKCGKISCRLCDKETHVPLSCEEVKKDEKLTLRHVVEEAMSAALIRKCNKCQHPFIKEYGCNKMSCTHCGNKQCYICSKTVSGYEHFGDTAKGRCALHDNVEDVHEQAVKKAAKDAMAQIRAEDPTLSDADLMIQVSDRVKQGEAVRRERANERLNEFPYAMVGDRLAYRNADRAGGGLVPRPERHQYVPLPFPDVEQYRYPFPPPLYDEIDAEWGFGDDPGYFEPGIDHLDPYHAPALHRPFHRPWLIPPPRDYVFDRHLNLFRHPFRERYYDPHNSHFYFLDLGIVYDAEAEQWFRIEPHMLDRFHRLDPNLF
ncbi:hypothetical protein C7974DRAFT_319627 [Boeremia exigua]|uniref:uncharacterized protein n=1 Tax=Boeremia exigua TaxID=749465 RepID=UPI001E8E4726|nr:uncharacterized protein C7974DRAFT_319627 [Boeremia exigua]KAH6614968.1 hypothetical protein C7974DRAFT_319627 [Boeremia exigua]